MPAQWSESPHIARITAIHKLMSSAATSSTSSAGRFFNSSSSLACEAGRNRLAGPMEQGSQILRTGAPVLSRCQVMSDGFRSTISRPQIIFSNRPAAAVLMSWAAVLPFGRRAFRRVSGECPIKTVGGGSLPQGFALTLTPSKAGVSLARNSVSSIFRYAAV